MKKIFPIVVCLSISNTIPSIAGENNSMNHNVPRQQMPIPTFWKKIARGQQVPIDQIKELFLYDVENNKHENKSIPEKSPDILRVMTFNVRMWTNLNDEQKFTETTSLIRSLDPDILMLQEVTDWQKTYDYFIGAGYSTVTSSCITQNPPFGPAIFAKNISIISTYSSSFKHQTHEGRQLSFARLDATIDATPIAIYTTHLEVDHYAFDKQGIVSGITIREALRQQQLEEIIADIKTLPHTNIIIAGDFNSIRLQDYEYTIDTLSVSTLIKKILSNSFKTPYKFTALNYLENNHFRTSFELLQWQGPKSTNWAARILDFIFFSPSWPFPLTGSYLYYTNLSDHLPVIADMKIKL